MLSFLQERLVRSPPKPQKNMTRQETIVSAFNRINGRNSSKEASTTPSLTTATSMTDSSSELTDSSAKKDICTRTSKRSRTSIGSYNENVLSGQLSRLSRKQGSETSNANQQGLIVRDEDNYTQERLLQEGVQALDEDWDLGAMPGENLNLPIKEEGGVQRRRSTRLDMLENASSVMAKTTGVLGKRGRETMEAGMEKLHSLTGANKRLSLRPRQAEKAIAEGRAAKRARFSEVSKREEPSPEPLSNRKSVKKPLKLWLSQGLYVGQHPEFDPRLTETKNKMKKPSTKANQSSRNQAMPLPMFAGERTLEKGRDFKLPFDVFSPLPPGQPKPDEWKKTHKSMPQPPFS